jgi:hypothetical protein
MHDRMPVRRGPERRERRHLGCVECAAEGHAPRTTRPQNVGEPGLAQMAVSFGGRVLPETHAIAGDEGLVLGPAAAHALDLEQQMPGTLQLRRSRDSRLENAARRERVAARVHQRGLPHGIGKSGRQLGHFEGIGTHGAQFTVAADRRRDLWVDEEGEG